jgi:uncharacterized membrane protein YfcA
MKIDKMGVAVLMSHLIITLAVLAIYAVSSYNGKLDDTIRTLLTVIIGYWFGAIGANAIAKKKEDSSTKEGE